MARIVLNQNSTQPLGGPNTGLGTDEGDLWNTIVTNLNTMLTEVYAGVKNAAGTTVRQSGNIFATVAQVTSTATTASQTLASFTLPANTLDSVNRGIDVMAWGTVAGNAAPKTIKIAVGGASLVTATSTQSGVTWIMTAVVYKVAANSQALLFTGQTGTTLTNPSSTSDTSVDTNTIAVTVSCLDASAAISNVVLNGFTIEYFN